MLWQKLLGTNPPSPIEYVGGRALGFVGTTSNVFVSIDGTLTGGTASSPSIGDLVIVYFATGSTSDRNLSIGSGNAPYTEVVELYADDTFDTNLAVAYRRLTGEGLPSDLDSLSISGGTGSTSDAGAVAVQVWRNVNRVTPFAVTQTTATGTNSVLCDPPLISSLPEGAFVVSGGAGAHNAGTQTFSNSSLNEFISAGATDTNSVTIGLGYHELQPGFDSFNPSRCTFSSGDSTSFSWAAVTLALRPE